MLIKISLLQNMSFILLILVLLQWSSPTVVCVTVTSYGPHTALCENYTIGFSNVSLVNAYSITLTSSSTITTSGTCNNNPLRIVSPTTITSTTSITAIGSRALQLQSITVGGSGLRIDTQTANTPTCVTVPIEFSGLLYSSSYLSIIGPAAVTLLSGTLISYYSNVVVTSGGSSCASNLTVQSGVTLTYSSSITFRPALFGAMQLNNTMQSSSVMYTSSASLGIPAVINLASIDSSSSIIVTQCSNCRTHIIRMMDGVLRTTAGVVAVQPLGLLQSVDVTVSGGGGFIAEGSATIFSSTITVSSASSSCAAATSGTLSILGGVLVSGSTIAVIGNVQYSVLSATLQSSSQMTFSGACTVSFVGTSFTGITLSGSAAVVVVSSPTVGSSVSVSVPCSTTELRLDGYFNSTQVTANGIALVNLASTCTFNKSSITALGCSSGSLAVTLGAGSVLVDSTASVTHYGAGGIVAFGPARFERSTLSVIGSTSSYQVNPSRVTIAAPITNASVVYLQRALVSIVQGGGSISGGVTFTADTIASGSSLAFNITGGTKMSITDAQSGAIVPAMFASLRSVEDATVFVSSPFSTGVVTVSNAIFRSGSRLTLVATQLGVSITSLTKVSLSLQALSITLAGTFLSSSFSITTAQSTFNSSTFVAPIKFGATTFAWGPYLSESIAALLTNTESITDGSQLQLSATLCYAACAFSVDTSKVSAGSSLTLTLPNVYNASNIAVSGLGSGSALTIVNAYLATLAGSYLPGSNLVISGVVRYTYLTFAATFTMNGATAALLNIAQSGTFAPTLLNSSSLTISSSINTMTFSGQNVFGSSVLLSLPGCTLTGTNFNQISSRYTIVAAVFTVAGAWSNNITASISVSSSIAFIDSMATTWRGVTFTVTLPSTPSLVANILTGRTLTDASVTLLAPSCTSSSCSALISIDNTIMLRSTLSLRVAGRQLQLNNFDTPSKNNTIIVSSSDKVTIDKQLIVDTVLDLNCNTFTADKDIVQFHKSNVTLTVANANEFVSIIDRLTVTGSFATFLATSSTCSGGCTQIAIKQSQLTASQITFVAPGSGMQVTGLGNNVTLAANVASVSLTGAYSTASVQIVAATAATIRPSTVSSASVVDISVATAANVATVVTLADLVLRGGSTFALTITSCTLCGSLTFSGTAITASSVRLGTPRTPVTINGLGAMSAFSGVVAQLSIVGSVVGATVDALVAAPLPSTVVAFSGTDSDVSLLYNATAYVFNVSVRNTRLSRSNLSISLAGRALLWSNTTVAGASNVSLAAASWSVSNVTSIVDGGSSLLVTLVGTTASPAAPNIDVNRGSLAVMRASTLEVVTGNISATCGDLVPSVTDSTLIFRSNPPSSAIGVLQVSDDCLNLSATIAALVRSVLVVSVPQAELSLSGGSDDSTVRVEGVSVLHIISNWEREALIVANAQRVRMNGTLRNVSLLVTSTPNASGATQPADVVLDGTVRDGSRVTIAESHASPTVSRTTLGVNTSRVVVGAAIANASVLTISGVRRRWAPGADPAAFPGAAALSTVLRPTSSAEPVVVVYVAPVVVAPAELSGGSTIALEDAHIHLDVEHPSCSVIPTTAAPAALGVSTINASGVRTGAIWYSFASVVLNGLNTSVRRLNLTLSVQPAAVNCSLNATSMPLRLVGCVVASPLGGGALFGDFDASSPSRPPSLSALVADSTVCVSHSAAAASINGSDVHFVAIELASPGSASVAIANTSVLLEFRAARTNSTAADTVSSAYLTALLLTPHVRVAQKITYSSRNVTQATPCNASFTVVVVATRCTVNLSSTALQACNSTDADLLLNYSGVAYAPPMPNISGCACRPTTPCVQGNQSRVNCANITAANVLLTCNCTERGGANRSWTVRNASLSANTSTTLPPSIADDGVVSDCEGMNSTRANATCTPLATFNLTLYVAVNDTACVRGSVNVSTKVTVTTTALLLANVSSSTNSTATVSVRISNATVALAHTVKHRVSNVTLPDGALRLDTMPPLHSSSTVHGIVVAAPSINTTTAAAAVIAVNSLAITADIENTFAFANGTSVAACVAANASTNSSAAPCINVSSAAWSAGSAVAISLATVVVGENISRATNVAITDTTAVFTQRDALAASQSGEINISVTLMRVARSAATIDLNRIAVSAVLSALQSPMERRVVHAVAADQVAIVSNACRFSQLTTAFAFESCAPDDFRIHGGTLEQNATSSACTSVATCGGALLDVALPTQTLLTAPRTVVIDGSDINVSATALRIVALGIQGTGSRSWDIVVNNSRIAARGGLLSTAGSVASVFGPQVDAMHVGGSYLECLTTPASSSSLLFAYTGYGGLPRIDFGSTDVRGCNLAVSVNATATRLFSSLSSMSNASIIAWRCATWDGVGIARAALRNKILLQTAVVQFEFRRDDNSSCRTHSLSNSASDRSSLSESFSASGSQTTTETQTTTESPSHSFNDTESLSSSTTVTTSLSESSSDSSTASQTPSITIDPCNTTFRDDSSGFVRAVTPLDNIVGGRFNASDATFLTLDRVQLATIRTLRLQIGFNTFLRNFYYNTSLDWFPLPQTVNCFASEYEIVNATDFIVRIDYDPAVSLRTGVTDSYFCNLTFSTDIFQCQLMTNFTFNFSATILVTGTPQLVSSVAEESLSISVSAVALLSGGAALLQQSRARSLGELASCQFSLVDDLSVQDSPLQFGFGSPLQYYYRGCVVGNIVLVSGMFLVLLLAAVIWACLGRKDIDVCERPEAPVLKESKAAATDEHSLQDDGSSELLLLAGIALTALDADDDTSVSNVSLDLEPERPVTPPLKVLYTRKESFSEALRRVTGRMSFPSIVFVPSMLLVDSTVLSSVRLLVHRIDPYDDVIGGVGLAVYGLQYAALVYITSTARRAPTAVTVKMAHPLASSSRIGSALRYLLLPSMDFRAVRMRERHRYNMVRYVVDDSRYPAFLCCDVALSILVAALVGVGISRRELCAQLAIGGVVGYALFFTAACVLRPELNRLGLILNIGSAALGLMSSIVTLSAMHTGMNALFGQVISMLMLCAGLLNFVATVIAMAAWVIVARATEKRERELSDTHQHRLKYFLDGDKEVDTCSEASDDSDAIVFRDPNKVAEDRTVDVLGDDVPWKRTEGNTNDDDVHCEELRVIPSTEYDYVWEKLSTSAKDVGTRSLINGEANSSAYLSDLLASYGQTNDE